MSRYMGSVQLVKKSEDLPPLDIRRPGLRVDGGQSEHAGVDDLTPPDVFGDAPEYLEWLERVNARDVHYLHPGGGHNQKSHAGGGKSSSPSMNFADMMAFDAEMADRYPQWGNAVSLESGDKILGELMTRQGFYAPVRTASAAEMDEMVADGATEVYRGVSDRQFSDDLITQGPTSKYTGAGVDGNGLYSSQDRRRAEQYAGQRGHVDRIVIDPSANVKTSRELGQMQDVLKKQQKIDTGDWAPEIPTRLRDPGRFAVSQGVDIIHVEGYIGSETFVILNRAVVVIQR